MFCKKCGKEIYDTAKFCPGCGASTERTAPAPVRPVPEEPVYAVPEEPEKKGGSGIVALLIVLCVILLAAGVGLCYMFRDVLFGKSSVDEEKLDAANQRAEELFTAAQEAQELLTEEGISMEDGCYLMTESYEKPEEAPEVPESGAVSVSDPEYFYWTLSEEFEEVEELGGFGFYVEDEEIVSVIVEEESVIGGYPVPVVPENAEDMELNEEALEIAAGEETEMDSEEETNAAYAWYLEPTLEAEDVIVSNLDTTTTYYAQFPSALEHCPHAECAVVLQDGKYGIIGYEGGWFTEPEHDTALLWQMIDCPTIAGNVYVFPGEDALVVEEDSDWGIGGNAYNYYLDNATGVVYITDDFGNVVPYNLPYPVRMQTADVTMDEYNVGTVSDIGDLYGAGTRSGALLPCEYEDVHTMQGMEVFAVHNGEGWGYFNAQGEQIIDFVCEGFPRSEIVNDMYSNAEGEAPYIPTEGYIAVKIDGECGYYDTNGEEVIPCGTFEDVRPVHGGLAWVKQDGLWGVISFDVPEEPDEEDETSEEGETPEETEDYNQIALTVLDTWLTGRITGDEELAMSVYPVDYPELQLGAEYSEIEGYVGYALKKFALFVIPSELCDEWNQENGVEVTLQIDYRIQIIDENGDTSGDSCSDLLVKKDGEWILISDNSWMDCTMETNTAVYEYSVGGNIEYSAAYVEGEGTVDTSCFKLDDGTKLTLEEAEAQGYIRKDVVDSHYIRKNEDGTFTLLPIAADGSVVDENGNVLVEAD